MDDIETALLGVTEGSNTDGLSVALSESDDDDYDMLSSGDERAELSDSSSDDDGPLDEYDENFVGDEEDQRMLASKTEIEREAIISERYAAREKAIERRDAKRRVKREKRERREAERRAKEKKKKKTPGKRAPEKKKKSSTPKVTTYRDDYEEEEDVPWSDDDADADYGADGAPAYEDEPLETAIPLSKDDMKRPLDFEDVKELQVRRDQLHKWADGDFLSEKLPGLFVRVYIGNDSTTRQPTYRLATVAAAKEDKRGHRIGDKRTFYYLKLQVGNSTRNMNLEKVSNQDVKESEFIWWTKMMEKANKPLPTRKQCLHLMNNLTYMNEYKFTESDISKLINKKKRLLRSVPVNLAEERATLLMKRDAYITEDAHDKLVEVNNKLEELEERIREQESRVDKKTQSMKNINERNRKLNFERGITTKDEMDVVEDPREKNPFTRRSCAPSVVSFKAPPTDAEVAAQKKAKEEQRKRRQKVQVDRTFAFSTDRIQKVLEDAHDVNITVDLNAQPRPTPFRFVPQKRPHPDDVLTLSEYKRRAGWN